MFECGRGAIVQFRPESPVPGATLLSMTRAQNTTIWGLALVIGAFVLGRGDDTLPWAVGAVGVVALIGGALVALNERDAAQLAVREEGRNPDAERA